MSIDVAFRRESIPVAVIVATLGLTVVAGIGRIPHAVVAIPVVMVGVVILLMTLRQIGVGVALLPLIAAAVPLSVGTGTQSPLVAGLLWAALLLGLWFVRSVLGHDFTMTRSFVFLPTIALILIWTLSYLYADAVHSPLVYVWEDYRRSRTGQLGVVVISAGALLLALRVGRDLRWIRMATWSMIVLGVVGIILFFTGISRTSIGAYLSTGGLFTLWVVCLSYGQALYNQDLPRWLRVGLVVLVIAWMYKAIFLQNIWFSGWVPALVAIAVITLFWSPRAFFVMLIVAAPLVLLNWHVVYSALWSAKVAEGDTSRFGIWDQALALFYQHPILGTGPAGYAAYYQSIYKGSQFSMSTHSNYMDVVIETGIVGVAIFAWFMGSLLISGWQARLRWRSGFTGGFAQGAFGGFFGVLAAMFLGDWFIPFVYNQTIAGFRYTSHSWVFLGFLAALATMKATTGTTNRQSAELPVAVPVGVDSEAR